MTSANEDPNPLASAKTRIENQPTDESDKTGRSEHKKPDQGDEVALDPHPSKALGELITGTEESSSKDA